MMKTQIYTHQSGLNHDTGPGHPECPERLRVLHELFKEAAFADLPVIEAEEADIDWIMRAHSQDYVSGVEEAIPSSGLSNLDGDTIVSPGSWDAAIHAAGAVCQAVGDVMKGKCKNAFCATRPPGHHAEPAQSMGFCLFNNAVIGALHAQAEYGAKKVAIIDFDVHHGNGSDTMARKHDNLFYISTHQSPFFPGTGSEDSNVAGRVMNVPLPAGTGSKEFRKAYENRIFPALNDFAPDLIIISAGFDGHKDDPIGGFNLVEDDFKWITQELMKIAETHCQGKIVSTLEGGYNLKALKSSVSTHIKALASI